MDGSVVSVVFKGDARVKGMRSRKMRVTRCILAVISGADRNHCEVLRVWW